MIHYLLLCHKNFNQVQLLIDKLKTKNSKIYIHVDGKVKDFPKLKNAELIKNRIKTNWGGFSLVQCELNGIYEIYPNMKEGDHLIIISGQCRPIKKIQDIEKYINNLGYKSCINYEKIEGRMIERVEKYYLNDIDLHVPHLNKFLYHIFVKKLGYNIHGLKIPIINIILSCIVNKIFPKRKYLLSNYHLFKGWQWICISYKHLIRIIGFLESKKGKKYYKSFKWSNCSDELFFQTLLYNSPLKDEIKNETLWYLKWMESTSSPYTITEEFYDELVKSKKLFARKFDINVDWRIVKKLENSQKIGE